MSSNVIFLCVQSLEKVSIRFFANNSCSLNTTLFMNASTWPFYSFFSSVYFYFYRTTVLSRMIFPQTSPQGIILNSLELWPLLIVPLHLYILISCKVFCYFWISYSLKENEFPLLSVFGIKCRRGFDHMHVTYIYKYYSCCRCI